MWIFLTTFWINRYSAFVCIPLGTESSLHGRLVCSPTSGSKIDLLFTAPGNRSFCGPVESYSGACFEPWGCWYVYSFVDYEQPQSFLYVPSPSARSPCRQTASGACVIRAAQGPLVTGPPCSSSRFPECSRGSPRFSLSSCLRDYLGIIFLSAVTASVFYI